MAAKKDHLTDYIEKSRAKSEAFDRAWQYRLLVRKLIKRRLELGLTQQHVADKLGVARARIAEIENAKKIIGADRLLHYASALEIEVRLVNTQKSRAGSPSKRVRSGQMKVAEKQARYKS